MFKEKTTILSDLCSAIQNSLSCVNTTESITYFLLGNKMVSDETEISTNTLTKYRLTNRPPLSPTNYKKIAASNNWDLETLSKYAAIHSITNTEKGILTRNIYDIYRKYYPETDVIPSINTMLHALVHLHFFGCRNANSFFEMYTEKQCMYYQSREKLEKAITDLLNKHNLLFISGGPASGKKELVKHYISQNNFTQIGWSLSPYEYIEIKERIKDLPFVTSPNSIAEAKEYLLEKTASSLLVIDAPILTKKDFEFIDSFFQGLELKVIFTTRAQNFPPQCQVLNMGIFPVEKLSILYQSISTAKQNETSSEEKQSLFSDDSDFEKLCKIIDYNPLVITLLAKIAKQSPNIQQLKEDLLDPDIWVWKNALPTIHSSYKSKTDPYTSSKTASTLTTIMFRILKDYDIKYLASFGIQLSVFAKEPIEVTILSHLLKKPKELQEALAGGLLVYSNTQCTKLYMPNLIVHTLWQKFPLSGQQLNHYGSEIGHWLKKMMIDTTIPLSVLCDIVSNMVFRYHFNIFIVRTYKDYTDSCYIWNSFLFAITEYFNQLGNSDLGSVFHNLLYKYKNLRHPQKEVMKKTHMEEYIEALINQQSILLASHNIADIINCNIPKVKKTKSTRSKSRKTDEKYKFNVANSALVNYSLIMYILIQDVHNIFLKKLFTHKPLQLDDFSQEVLDQLGTLIELCSKKKPTLLSTYYSFIYFQLQLLYGNSQSSIKIQESRYIFYQLLNASNENVSELLFNFNVYELFYYILHNVIHCIKKCMPFTNPLTNEFFVYCYKLCHDYYDILQENKFSIHAKWLLYSSIVLLDAITPETIYHLQPLLNNLQNSLCDLLKDKNNSYNKYCKIVKDFKIVFKNPIQ